MKSCDGASKLERKAVEKNRRMHMKNLCFKLSSSIPKDHFSKDMMTQQDHLDLATSYIRYLRETIERLKCRKDMGMGNHEIHKEMMVGFRLPVIEVRHLDSILEVVLISGLKQRFMFHEVISILEEEGAEVINANFSIVGDKVYHTIHSQEVCPRIGVDASRVSKRLRGLIH